MYPYSNIVMYTTEYSKYTQRFHTKYFNWMLILKKCQHGHEGKKFG